MKIDLEYIKEILEIILEHEHPDFRIDHPKLKPMWLNDDDKLNKLVFHMEILEDQNIIESSISSPGLGFNRMGNGGIAVSVKALRLTAQGHQFASDLSKPGVIEKLTTSFKELGPSEAVKVVFELGKKSLDIKLSKLIDE